jgi:DNA-binding response OmpR family regulator
MSQHVTPTAIVAASAEERRLVARALSDLDVRTEEVPLRADLLKSVGAGKPDVVIVDLDVPQFLDAIRILRNLSPGLAILALGGRRMRRSGVVPGEPVAFIDEPIDANALKEHVRSIVRSIGGPRFAAERRPLHVELPQLHDPNSGRIHAGRVAEFLDVPLRRLAFALNANYKQVHKTPDAVALQEGLIPIKRSLVILSAVLGDPGTVRAWLNSPHPDLGSKTPLTVILEGHAGALRAVLENAVAGIPS